MDPAIRVVVEAELASAVGDDHGVLEEAVGLDASPKRALGGDLDWIGMNAGPCMGEFD